MCTIEPLSIRANEYQPVPTAATSEMNVLPPVPPNYSEM